jgi:hypothetical protein
MMAGLRRARELEEAEARFLETESAFRRRLEEDEELSARDSQSPLP